MLDRLTTQIHRPLVGLVLCVLVPLALLALGMPSRLSQAGPATLAPQKCSLVTDGHITGPQSADPKKPLETQAGAQLTVPPTVVRGLVRWIGQHTAYDISKTLSKPPTVRFCHRGTEIHYEGQETLVDPLLRAAYDLKTRRIYLVQPWQASNITNRSTLLHELIHDVQYLNRSWACKEEPEWEAYKLQEAWLAEQGVRSGFDWMQILLLSRCPRDVHP